MGRKITFAALGLTAAAGFGEAVILARIRMDPLKLAALMESLALVLGAFVALTQASFVRHLREIARRSAAIAFALAFTLLIPYFVLALGTGTFALAAFAKLTSYIAIPTALLVPDRIHGKESAGWRDYAAMVALAWPVGAGWLANIWVWPEDFYVFRPLFCVCVGAYGFMVLRNLEGVGYRLWFRKRDVVEAVVNFVAFALLAIPLGLALRFIHPHTARVALGRAAVSVIGIYLTVAIPEEFLFRGILQNLLQKSIHSGKSRGYALVIASLIFGLSHLHHAPVPNWRYAIMATLAGLFYGNVYNVRGRVSASALTHTLVDTVWHFWF